MDYGFLRENEIIAQKAGIDKATGIGRTGLEIYLKQIFPNINDWEHDKIIPKATSKIRPDYRSETLKIIIEFDGVPHYQYPDIILKDKEKDKIYSDLGYKIIRIPFFIQLNKYAINKLFNINFKKNLFKYKVPTISIESRTHTSLFL